MPKYSLIIPVYNCIDYLPACVESVLNQTQQDFELLFVDDGSTDGSGDLCDEMSEKHTQVKAFHKSNGGAASARNAGIDNASGDYLLFIDSDDTIEPNTLELIDETVVEADMVIFGMAFDYYGKSSCIERTENLSCGHEGLFGTEEIINSFKSFFEDNALSSACNKCFRRDIIRENGLQFVEGMTMYEDLEFALRYIKRAKKVLCIGQTLYHYRLSDAEKQWKSRVSDLDKLRDNLSKLTGSMPTLESKEAACVAAKLNIQLLMKHLTVTKYTTRELEKKIKSYCNAESFKIVPAQRAELGKSEADLLGMIESGQYCKLNRRFRIKRIKARIKSMVRRCLKAIGLYH